MCTTNKCWTWAFLQYLLILNSVPKTRRLGVCGGGMWRDGLGRSGIDLKFDCMWAEMNLLRVTTVIMVIHTVPGK